MRDAKKTDAKMQKAHLCDFQQNYLKQVEILYPLWQGE